MTDPLFDPLQSGLNNLLDYLSQHVLTCLVPAFFIAGAIAAYVKKDAILRYFGPQTKKYISYPVAAVSGTVLAVCSCTILPLFAGIYKKGSGLGPAGDLPFRRSCHQRPGYCLYRSGSRIRSWAGKSGRGHRTLRGHRPLHGDHLPEGGRKEPP